MVGKLRYTGIKNRFRNKLGTIEEMYIHKLLISLLHVMYRGLQHRFVTMTCEADLYEFLFQ